MTSDRMTVDDAVGEWQKGQIRGRGTFYFSSGITIYGDWTLDANASKMVCECTSDASYEFRYSTNMCLTNQGESMDVITFHRCGR